MTRTFTGILAGMLLGVTFALAPQKLPDRAPSQYHPGRFGVIRVMLRPTRDAWAPPEREVVRGVLDRMTALGFAWEWAPEDPLFFGSSTYDVSHLRNLVLRRVDVCYGMSPGSHYNPVARLVEVAPQCVPWTDLPHVLGHGIGHAIGMEDICPTERGELCSEVGRGRALMNPSFATDGFGPDRGVTPLLLPATPTLLDLAEFERARVRAQADE
jgi:hypothetical protein